MEGKIKETIPEVENLKLINQALHNIANTLKTISEIIVGFRERIEALEDELTRMKN